MPPEIARHSLGIDADVKPLFGAAMTGMLEVRIGPASPRSDPHELR
jgi:hypothetical protein